MNTSLKNPESIISRDKIYVANLNLDIPTILNLIEII